MADDSFDLVVIGGGPGGYVAALRGAQLGMSVACVDRRDTPGGTCLNVGCIPSKALLHSSEQFAAAREELAAHGVNVKGVELDLKRMMARKDKVVGELVRGIETLFGKNKVAYLKGTAHVAGKREVAVALNDGGNRGLRAANIVIATGSESATLPGLEVDEKRIVSSTGALSLKEVPKRLVVIGAGYIGLELGSVWRRLGAQVTVIEVLDRILPGMDGEVAKQFQRILARQGLAFRLKSKVAAAKVGAKGVTLTVEPADGGKPETLKADVVLIAVGRRPYTEGVGLEDVGAVLDNQGRVVVDENGRTNVDGLYAIGDVIRGPMLAHKAEEDGIATAETIAGQVGHVNYDAIPGVVYTFPEVATVGRTEEELKAAGTEYRAGRFPFVANSRGRTYGQTEGFVKILASAETDRILGVHIVAAAAGELIAEAVLAMEFGASAEDLARTCHAHPTFSEAMREAALAVDSRAIHI